MKQAFLLLLITTTLFACKKDDDVVVPADPKLEGKWTINNIVTKEYTNNVLVNTTTEPGSGKSIDFQTNGTVVMAEPGSPAYTATYVIAGSKVTIDGDIFDIQNLKQQSVTLYIKDAYAAGYYDEVFVNMTR
jgi:hypothetical protein